MYEKGQYIVYGIRGVCQVADIITIDHPVGPKGRLYYELHPYNQKDGKIVTPVDSEKTITRLLLTRPEAEALIQEIPQIKEMTVANDKQREERYKRGFKNLRLPCMGEYDQGVVSAKTGPDRAQEKGDGSG